MSSRKKKNILGIAELKKCWISWYFHTYEHLKFHAQLSLAWKNFDNLDGLSWGLTETADLVQMPQDVASDQGLHCLFKKFLWKIVKNEDIHQKPVKLLIDSSKW